MVAKLPQSISCHVAGKAEKAFQIECIEFFSDWSQIIGFPRSVGQIYGLLFGSTQPLSFTDIVGKLGISKGSVSQGLRTLREIGAIAPANQSDVARSTLLLTSVLRRDHFVPETELRKLLAGFLHGKIRMHMQRGTKRLEAYSTLHGASLAAESSAGRLLLQRLSKLQSWHRKGVTVLPFITKFIS